jgi:hypothetical protein
MKEPRAHLAGIPKALVLATLVAAPPLAAQNSHNEVMRFGARDLVQTKIHKTTKYSLEIPGAQPPGFMTKSTTGVAAGVLTWIWYPSQLNSRLEARFVTGHMIAVRPSSATPLRDYSLTHAGQKLAGVPIYLPKFSIWEPLARAPRAPVPVFGAGFDPDFSRSPLLTYNTVHTPLVQPAQADQALMWTVTYNLKVKVTQREMVFAYEWRGGEHFTKPRSQSLPTGWSESMFAPAHWGWAAPGTKRTITHFDPAKILPGSGLTVYSSPMGGYFEDQATICFHSDWGETRNPALASRVYPSYNVGSGLSDLGSKAGGFAWDAFASSVHQGKRAMPLLNVRAGPRGVGTPFLGQVLEVDPSDPVLALLFGNPFADGSFNSRGVFLPSRRIKVPALGASSIGLWVGMEFGIVDRVSGAALETTQAFWFYVGK